MEADIDIRPVVVDKLITFSEQNLTSRQARIEELIVEYDERIKTYETCLDEARTLRRFLGDEHDNVVLALKLKRGDVVRVVCPQCKGSGMKAVDVTTGRLASANRTAFETIKTNPIRIEDDPTLRCSECLGKRWVMMERFKG